MSWIDVVIASLVVIAALRGWVEGLLRQVGSFVGRVVGFFVGCYAAVSVAARVSALPWRVVDVILIVGVATVTGGLIMRFFGGVFSARLREGHLGVADSLFGAAVGALGMLVTCWFVAALATVVPWSTVGQAVNSSVILRTVQRVLPSPPAIESRLQGVLSQLNVPSLFAHVVAPTLPSLIHGALPTRHDVVSPAAVVAVDASGACHHTNEATGFLVGPDEVVTVAHALAGEPRVRVAGRVASVVLFDPRSDLAVLRTGAWRVTPLSLASNSPSTSLARVVGFRSPFDRSSSAAILSGSVSAPGRDIYSGGVFERTMDVVVAGVTPAESGAPVLVSGRVVAVVAERVGVDPSLVYAVPLDQLRAALARVSAVPVSTQHCVS